MSGIIAFFNTIISAITSFFQVLGNGISYLLDIVNAMPAVIVGPLVAGVAILIIFVVLGRGS